MVRPSIFVALAVLLLGIAAVIFLALPQRPYSVRTRTTIGHLRRAAGLINRYKAEKGSIPTNPATLSLPVTYRITTSDEGSFLIVAPDAFYRNGKAFNYACDQQTNVVRTDVAR